MDKYDVIIAVDIGLTGGISFFDVLSKELLSVYKMPVFTQIYKDKKRPKLSIGALKFILEIPKVHNETALVIYENVHTFPGQGSVSTGTLLEEKGVFRGMLWGLGYEEFSVEPRTWQKYFDIVPPKELGKGKSKERAKTLRKNWIKNKSIEVAREKFPTWAESKLSDSKSHGLSDSMLIGQWYLENQEKE